jgi:hypothetical protein
MVCQYFTVMGVGGSVTSGAGGSVTTGASVSGAGGSVVGVGVGEVQAANSIATMDSRQNNTRADLAGFMFFSFIIRNPIDPISEQLSNDEHAKHPIRDHLLDTFFTERNNYG